MHHPGPVEESAARRLSVEHIHARIHVTRVPVNPVLRQVSRHVSVKRLNNHAPAPLPCLSVAHLVGLFCLVDFTPVTSSVILASVLHVLFPWTGSALVERPPLGYPVLRPHQLAGTLVEKNLAVESTTVLRDVIGETAPPVCRWSASSASVGIRSKRCSVLRSSPVR